MMTDSSGVDLSSLNLLSEVALVFQWEIGKDSNGFDEISKSTTMASFDVLVSVAETISRKGLLVDLGFCSIPKKTRSKANNERSKLCLRCDLLGFVVPKKKRSFNKCSSYQDRKRKRLDDDDDVDLDQSINFQNERVKRQRSSSINDQFSDQELVKSTPLWSFQRKSQLRFSLIKLNCLSARTTMVN